LETVTLVDAKGTALTRWTWLAGATQLAVPGHWFAKDQQFRLQRGSRTVDLYIHQASSVPDNPATLAAWMINSGCKSQALTLLKRL
jgi:hypothetical protein